MRVICKYGEDALRAFVHQRLSTAWSRGKPEFMGQSKDPTQKPGGQLPMRRSVPGGRFAVRRVSSSDLFAGAKEVIVTHGGEDYRLRHTSKGKLILTK